MLWTGWRIKGTTVGIKFPKPTPSRGAEATALRLSWFNTCRSGREVGLPMFQNTIAKIITVNSVSSFRLGHQEKGSRKIAEREKVTITVIALTIFSRPPTSNPATSNHPAKALGWGRVAYGRNQVEPKITILAIPGAVILKLRSPNQYIIPPTECCSPNCTQVNIEVQIMAQLNQGRQLNSCAWVVRNLYSQ